MYLSHAVLAPFVLGFIRCSLLRTNGFRIFYITFSIQRIGRNAGRMIAIQWEWRTTGANYPNLLSLFTFPNLDDNYQKVNLIARAYFFSNFDVGWQGAAVLERSSFFFPVSLTFELEMSCEVAVLSVRFVREGALHGRKIFPEISNAFLRCSP